MNINNVRTDNILAAAAQATKAKIVVEQREGWFLAAEAKYLMNQTSLEEAKDQLLYALKKLDTATTA